MEYHYEWTDYIDSTSQEAKKWNDSPWPPTPSSAPCFDRTRPLSTMSSHLPRCFSRMRSMRRRRFFHPPFNYVPRTTRPQWTSNVRNHDYKWNQVGVSMEPYPQSNYNYDVQCSCCPDSLNGKHACSTNVHSTMLVTSPEDLKQIQPYGLTGQSDYFPMKRTEENSWSECVYSGECYNRLSLPMETSSRSDFRNYAQNGAANNSVVGYNPTIAVGENGQGYINKAPSPVNNQKCRYVYPPQSEVFQQNVNVNEIHAIPGDDDRLNAIIKETIGESLKGECYPAVLNSENFTQDIPCKDTSLPQHVKGETEMAVYNLELLCPSITFICDENEKTQYSSQTVNETNVSITLQNENVDESPVQNSVAIYDPASATSHQNENISSPSEKNLVLYSNTEETKAPENANNDSKQLTLAKRDKIESQDSMTTLIEQNQLLTDLISQIISDKFEFQKDFMEACQMTDVTLAPDKTTPDSTSTQYGNKKFDENSGSKSMEILPSCSEAQLTQTDFGTYSAQQNPLVGSEESNSVKNEIEIKSLEEKENYTRIDDITEAESIFSEIFDYEMGSGTQYPYLNVPSPIAGGDVETTLTNYILEDSSNDFLKLSSVKSMFDKEDSDDDVLSQCVAPDSVLKHPKQSRRKKIKKVVQVKTKKTKTRCRTQSKDEEEIVQKYFETNEYVSSEGEAHAPLKSYCDAQTQVLEDSFSFKQPKTTDRQDAESQWEDDGIRNLCNYETSKSKQESDDSNKTEADNTEKPERDLERHKSQNLNLYSENHGGSFYNNSCTVNLGERTSYQEHSNESLDMEDSFLLANLINHYSVFTQYNSNLIENVVDIQRSLKQTNAKPIYNFQSKPNSVLDYEKEKCTTGHSMDSHDGKDVEATVSMSKTQESVESLNAPKKCNAKHGKTETQSAKQSKSKFLCDATFVSEMMDELNDELSSIKLVENQELLSIKSIENRELPSINVDSPSIKSIESPSIKSIESPSIESVENHELQSKKSAENQELPSIKRVENEESQCLMQLSTVCMAQKVKNTLYHPKKKTKSITDVWGHKTLTEVEPIINQGNSLDIENLHTDFKLYKHNLRPRRISQNQNNNKIQPSPAIYHHKVVEDSNAVAPLRKRRKTTSSIPTSNKKQKRCTEKVISENNSSVPNSNFKRRKSQNSNNEWQTPKVQRSKQEFVINLNSSENRTSRMSVGSHESKSTISNNKNLTERKKRTSSQRRYL